MRQSRAMVRVSGNMSWLVWSALSSGEQSTIPAFGFSLAACSMPCMVSAGSGS